MFLDNNDIEVDAIEWHSKPQQMRDYRFRPAGRSNQDRLPDRTIVKTGIYGIHKVFKYSDGTISYADVWYDQKRG